MNTIKNACAAMRPYVRRLCPLVKSATDRHFDSQSLAARLRSCARHTNCRKVQILCRRLAIGTIHNICTYTVRQKKGTNFLSSTKKDAHKRKLVLFFCLTVYMIYAGTNGRSGRTPDCHVERFVLFTKCDCVVDAYSMRLLVLG